MIISVDFFVASTFISRARKEPKNNRTAAVRKTVLKPII